MNAIYAGEPGFYEGLAAELPEAEPSFEDLAVVEADESGLAVQERLEARDIELALLVATGGVDELAVRRARRARRRALEEAA